MGACIHDESLHGRCVSCGKTWEEQSRERKCSSLKHFPQDGETKLQTCYLPDNHVGGHENYLANRSWS